MTVEVVGHIPEELAELVMAAAAKGAGGGAVTPPTRWSADELARRALLEQGVAVAVNLRRHRNLIAWAKERGLFLRVDRATPWGNPFLIGRDGDRATVIARYRDEHLPSRADLLARVGALRGKALGAGARRWRVMRTCWWQRSGRRRGGWGSLRGQPLGQGLTVALTCPSNRFV